MFCSVSEAGNTGVPISPTCESSPDRSGHYICSTESLSPPVRHHNGFMTDCGAKKGKNWFDPGSNRGPPVFPCETDVITNYTTEPLKSACHYL